MSEYPDVAQCPACWRTLNIWRCPCTYELDPPTPTAARPWKVTQASASVGVLFASESMARAYAERFGGTLTCAGRTVGAWPKPDWVLEIEGRATAAAQALPKVRDWKAL